MRLKVQRAGNGFHPSEVFITVDTRDGREGVVVDWKSLKNDTVEVGAPVGRDKKFLLVQLPRPTVRGPSRVWVNEADLQETPQEELA